MSASAATQMQAKIQVQNQAHQALDASILDQARGRSAATDVSLVTALY